MKIYTKQGDAGETGLFGGDRVSKDHSRIRSYGTLDELNSALGLAMAMGSLPDATRAAILRVQGEIFQLGAELATPRGRTVKSALIDQDEIQALEKEIDAMEAELPPLRSFILPGGSPGSAYLHLARSISRRGERELVSLNRAEPLRPAILQYVNRLSDYLFVCARYANLKGATQDVPWRAPASTPQA